MNTGNDTNFETCSEADDEVGLVGALGRLAPVVGRVRRALLAEVYDRVLQLAMALVTLPARLVTSQCGALGDVEQTYVLGHWLARCAKL